MTYSGMTQEELEMMAKAQVEQIKQQSEAQGQTLTDEEIMQMMTVPGAGKSIPTGTSQPTSQTQPTTNTGIQYVNGIAINMPTNPTELQKNKAQELAQKIRDRGIKTELPKESFASADVTSSIPFDRKAYESIDFGNNAGRKVWRALTPWSEERGETQTSYIKDLPRRMIEGATQTELKEAYEAEQNNPLWSRILLGGDTVIKDKKTGEYISIVAGEAPLITPAKGIGLAKDVAVNYTKILELAKQYKLETQWEKLIASLKLGNIKFKRIEKTFKQAEQAAKNLAEAQAAVREAKYAGKVDAAIQKLLQQEINAEKAVKAAEAAKLQAIEKANLKILTIPGLRVDPTALNKETIKTIRNLYPEKAIEELNKTGLTQTIALSHPDEFTKIVTEVSPKIQTQVITDIQTITKQSAQQKELTKTQLERINKLIEKIRNQTKAETETKTETKAKEQTETKTQTQTETKTETKTDTKQETPTKREQPQEKESTGEGGYMRTGDFNYPRPTSNFEQSKARKIIKESGGAIAWRMGKVGKRDRWDTVVNPYTSNEQYLMILGKQPEGATILQRGKGSAYGTTQVVRGTAPKRDVKVDSGIVDITISPAGKRSVRMKVTPDPKQQTTGDITIGRNKTQRISMRNRRISPRVPKLR